MYVLYHSDCKQWVSIFSSLGGPVEIFLWYFFPKRYNNSVQHSIHYSPITVIVLYSAYCIWRNFRVCLFLVNTSKRFFFWDCDFWVRNCYMKYTAVSAVGCGSTALHQILWLCCWNNVKKQPDTCIMANPSDAKARVIIYLYGDKFKSVTATLGLWDRMEG